MLKYLISNVSNHDWIKFKKFVTQNKQYRIVNDPKDIDTEVLVKTSSHEVIAKYDMIELKIYSDFDKATFYDIVFGRSKEFNL